MSTTPTQPSTPQPADRVSLGVVHAAIWRNVDDEGRRWYSVTFERRYRDQAGEWKSTNSFQRDDVLTLAKAADVANSRIHALQASDRKLASMEAA